MSQEQGNPFSSTDEERRISLQQAEDARRLALTEQDEALNANPAWREKNTKMVAAVAIMVVAGVGAAFGMPMWLAMLIGVGAFIWAAK